MILGPGAMLLLVNPPSTDKFLANGSTPILDPQRPAIVVQSNFELPMQHIVTEGTDINGFILHNCILSVSSFQVQNCKCGGNLCDRQDSSNRRCACYQMPNRSGNVMISVEVKVVCPDGSSFYTHLRSKWFFEKYIFTSEVPSGTRAHIFEDYMIGDRFFTAVENVTEYINGLCKFRVLGWAKRGEVQDQGVDQPNNGLPYNAARVMVQSGTLNHHITRLDPMKPQNVDIDHLEKMKFNVDRDFETNV